MRRKIKTLYVRNIERGIEESDESVEAKTVRYLQGKDVKIVNAKVVKNWWNQYIVGCKIGVYIEDVERVKSDLFWPDGVVCREWARKAVAQINPNDGEQS